MSYGPKNDDGDYPGMDDEITEDTTPEPMVLRGALDSAPLYREHAQLTPEQREALLKAEDERGRRATNLGHAVKALDAADALSADHADFTPEEWALVGTLQATARALRNRLHARDLKARHG